MPLHLQGISMSGGGFDLFALFTGGSGGGEAPNPAPKKQKPDVPVASPESVALAEAQRHRADYQKRQEGLNNQATRAREEARRYASTNRARALQLLESAKADEASAQALSTRIRDLNTQIQQLERGMGVAAHARITRNVQSALTNLTGQINVAEFEEARDAMHEAADDLDDFDDILRTPIGSSGSDARQTESERLNSLNQELDDMVGAEHMSELDGLPLLAPLPRPVASPPSVRVPVAMSEASVTSMQPPPPRATAVTTAPSSAQTSIAARLAASRAAAAKKV